MPENIQDFESDKQFSNWIRRVGLDEAMTELASVAAPIADRTPLGPGESWDDPEEWTINAAVLAHGVVALKKHLESLNS